MFFSFDGIDGAGKSTQIRLLQEWLQSHGREVIVCRDPGSSPLGETLRQVLLGNKSMEIGTRAEMLIYMASRAQLVDEVIRPAISSGQDVISDRFLLANLAYQGHGGGADLDSIRTVGRVATDGMVPDLTFLLDLPVPDAMKRINRPLDRIESKGFEYLDRVRQGFLQEAEQNPAQIVKVDAMQSAKEVGKLVLKHAEALLNRELKTR